MKISVLRRRDHPKVGVDDLNASKLLIKLRLIRDLSLSIQGAEVGSKNGRQNRKRPAAAL